MRADYLPFDGEAYDIGEFETERTSNLLDTLVALGETGTDWLESLYTRTETVN